MLNEDHCHVQIDFEEILIILKENGIVTKKENKTKTKFQDGLTEGDRNNECFKTACNLFEHQGLDFDSGLAFMKTWNGMSANPLSDSEVETVVKSAWNRIETKDKDEIPKRKEVDIYTVADQLMAEYTFITLEKSKEITSFPGSY